MDAMKKSLTSRLREFFGLKEGQTMSAFAAELKTLTMEDRKWFTDQFNAMGMPTEDTLLAK